MILDTLCKSWGGQKYVKCPDSDQCVLENRPEEDCVPIDSGTEKPDVQRSCDGDPNRWRCNDGFCIHSQFVCDGNPNCDDQSDEEIGCNLFPDTGCPSYFAAKHEKCVDWSNGGAQSVVCTLSEFIDAGECRNCTNPDEWRCDSGWCIPKDKVKDGIPDCKDGSDELRLTIEWWVILLFTMGLTLLGMTCSSAYRFLSQRVSTKNQVILLKNPGFLVVKMGRVVTLFGLVTELLIYCLN